MTTRSEMARRRILNLVPDLMDGDVGSHWILTAEGYMDLHVEVLDTGTAVGTVPYLDVSLAHYYEQNGDMMKDPEMTVRVYGGKHPSADALSFAQDGSIPYVSESYLLNEDGERVGCFQARWRDNNAFLARWLQNLEDQGHTISAYPDDGPDPAEGVPDDYLEALGGMA